MKVLLMACGLAAKLVTTFGWEKIDSKRILKTNKSDEF